jgi:hypothetical protein
MLPPNDASLVQDSQEDAMPALVDEYEGIEGVSMVNPPDSTSGH